MWSGRGGRCSSGGEPLPGALQRERRQQREQEVERRPVANRAGEDCRGQGGVREQQQREREEAPRREEGADERKRVEPDHVQGLDDLSSGLGDPAARLVVVLDRERRRPEHPYRLGGEPRLLAWV